MSGDASGRWVVTAANEAEATAALDFHGVAAPLDSLGAEEGGGDLEGEEGLD